MKLSQVTNQLESIAPPQYAEQWDNVGLLVGEPEQEVTRALLCIDYTDAVAEEAKGGSVDMVIAYHPPIFKPISRVTGLVLDAARRGVAIYSPHTALDVADGGTNDVLADVLELVDRQPLKVAEPKATERKLVTFVPEEHADAVARALFQAGAGWIGNYSCCSFRTPGTGTFFAEKGASPSVGQPGRLERVPEIKIETVVPVHKMATAVAALRASHPYEEPAFDVVELAAAPVTRGLGRVGRLDQPIDRPEVIARIKRGLGIDRVLVAGPEDGMVHTAAVCAGSCGDLLDEAVQRRVDLFLTGEMRHHDALRASQAGITVVCALHSNSERVTLAKLAHRLAQACPEIPFALSREVRDPFSVR
jgi:dinuclear metal center YbgI/SA1388 family protein